MTRYVLLGAGGHGKALVEAIGATGAAIAVYVDPRASDWLTARHETEETAVSPGDGEVAIGLGGLSSTKLGARLAMLDRFLDRGFAATPVVHPAAHVSPSATLEPGATILAGAVIQPGATVGRGAIINTNATVEHDSAIGAGAHVAPAAVVLGNCGIGDCCLIGASSVVLQGRRVPSGTFVAALSVQDGDRTQPGRTSGRTS